ncbi:hypothetical protein [Paenibacillus soyae]|uniref:Uncharacterized protein n=1 Tax=Paenibacillus soyae TaxID=2969249 RepID=A0A9X2MVH1_9BACL|nr:hypothetical protein [Paenibacillus soyae]MCR2807077.1 hypothetical protein [Paenibacillus soyae]
MDHLIISEDDMVKESAEFSKVYPILIHEIDHIERVRGKLNDFQLMLAVSRAKDSMGVLGWERRQTVNSILEKYAQIYREYDRESADEWVFITFGYRVDSGYETEAETMAETTSAHPQEEIDNDVDVSSRMQEVSNLIVMKEAELLQLYREFYLLSQRS